MTEYIVFPLSSKVVKISADNAEIAKKRYKEHMNYKGETLVIIPSGHGKLCGFETRYQLNDLWFNDGIKSIGKTALC